MGKALKEKDEREKNTGLGREDGEENHHHKLECTKSKTKQKQKQNPVGSGRRGEIRTRFWTSWKVRFLGQVQEAGDACPSRKEVLDLAVGLSSCDELLALWWTVGSTLRESPSFCFCSQTEGTVLHRCARCFIQVEHGAPGEFVVMK